jgi:hypothetical protein
MTTKLSKLNRNSLFGLLFLGLAVRVVMPAGYMPAPIGEGGPFVLCPAGLVGAPFWLPAEEGVHTHADHADDEVNQAGIWEFCRFGAVFGSSVLVSDVAISVPSPKADAPAEDYFSVASPFSIRILRARGPPQYQPLHV